MLTDVLALPSLRLYIGIGPNTEKDALNWVFHQSGRIEHVIYQPRPWFNGYGKIFDETPLVQDGDLLIHFVGYGEEKEEATGRWLDKPDGEEKRTPQGPIENTTYAAQTKDFWLRLRKAQEALDGVEIHRHLDWTHYLDHALIERVETKEKQRWETCQEEAYMELRMVENILLLIKELEFAETEAETFRKNMAEQIQQYQPGQENQQKDTTSLNSDTFEQNKQKQQKAEVNAENGQDKNLEHQQQQQDSENSNDGIDAHNEGQKQDQRSNVAERIAGKGTATDEGESGSMNALEHQRR